MTEQDAKNLITILSKYTTLPLLEPITSALLRLHTDFLFSQPHYADPRSIVRHQAQVFSQNGEDGIIAEIFKRIGTDNKRFIEIGVGDGDENNTRLLLETGWRGVWMESHPKNIKSIRETYSAELSDGRLRLIDGMATREYLAENSLEQQRQHADLLSIDIDMNTSHIWRSLPELRPRVAVIEYNSNFGAAIDFEVEYRADAQWTGDNIFGASLKRLELIGRKLGYSLVGCDVTGINAFFVRDDLVGEKFQGPFNSEQHYEPPRFAFLRCSMGHPQAKRARVELKAVT